MKLFPRFSIRFILALFWVLAVAGGFVAMARYEQTAGAAGETPAHWPSEAGIPLDPSHATLLMFAHPKCPCSRASIGELERLVSQCRGAVTPHVLFFTPKDASDDWAQTDLWKSARAIPGVSVEADSDGAAAKRFGAETSGYVVMYDSKGELLFKGGITVERGHAGDNDGESAIISLLAARRPTLGHAPVFGCSLKNPERCAHAGPWSQGLEPVSVSKIEFP